MTQTALKQILPVMQTIPPISSEDFKLGMRNLAGHCVVIAAAHGDIRAGLTATAICSITAEPPRILACVNRCVFAHSIIKRSGRLSINVLGSEQESIARRFAGMEPEVNGEERFVDDDWDIGEQGTPIMRCALAIFDCEVVETIAASTHDLFICEVQGITGSLDQHSALVYFAGQFNTINRNNI